MNYEKFLDRVQSIGISLPKKKAKKISAWDRAEYSPYRNVQWYNGVLALTNSWSTGGMTGGNCWNDDSPRSYTSDEKEPEWITLDEILEYFCPDISYLKHKKLMSLAQYETWTEYEYYGNCTDYAMKVLPLETLWKFLSENDLLSE